MSELEGLRDDVRAILKNTGHMQVQLGVLTERTEHLVTKEDCAKAREECRGHRYAPQLRVSDTKTRWKDSAFGKIVIGAATYALGAGILTIIGYALFIYHAHPTP